MEILPFILLNILSILIVGMLYFVTKEYYRIRGGKISRLGVVLTGTLIGIVVLLIYTLIPGFVYLSYQQTIGDIPIGGAIDSYQIYNGIILSPTIIIIIIFVIQIDNRLVFPLFTFQSIAVFLMIPEDGMFDQAVLVSSFIFEMLLYSVLIITLYFIQSVNLIKKNGITTIVSVVIYLISAFIMQTLFHISVLGKASWITTNNFFQLESILSLFLIVYFIPQFILIWIVERVYQNFSTLETFSSKDDVSYYKMSLAQNELVKMIDEKKINIGLIAIFQIKTSNEQIKSRVLDKIRISTERKYSNTFYFKASASYYGAFFELSDEFNLSTSLGNNKATERTEDDELKPISSEIDRISKEEGVQIISAGSIYGLQSYSIAELIEHSRYLMTPVVSRANSNPLIIYDFKRVRERLNETSKVRNLPIDTEKMSVSFLRALSSQNIYYPFISFGEDDNFTKILYDESITTEQKNILLRYTSYQVLRKFDKTDGKLVIYYPLSFLNSEEFKIKDFIKKINRYIDESKIIIGLDTNGGVMDENFENNINMLRELGIKLASINPTTITQEEHDKLRPDYILDITTDQNPLKIEKKKIKILTNAILLNGNLVI